jgi:hypothetical protein
MERILVCRLEDHLCQVAGLTLHHAFYDLVRFTVRRIIRLENRETAYMTLIGQHVHAGVNFIASRASGYIYFGIS